MRPGLTLTRPPSSPSVPRRCATLLLLLALLPVGFGGAQARAPDAPGAPGAPGAAGAVQARGFAGVEALAAPLEPRISHTAAARRGEAVSGRVSVRGPLASLRAELWGPGGAHVATVSGFPLRRTAHAEGERDWGFLLGLPSTLQAGSYYLQVRGAGGAGLFVYRGEVAVLAREFLSESIAFDDALSSLMTAPDPRREREAAELAEVLGAFREAAVFHTGAFILPLQAGSTGQGMAVRRTSFFADRRVYRYVDGGSSLSLHNGVDLAAPPGTPVAAAGSGRVVLAASRLMSGNSVAIEHLPGVYTLYFHLRDMAVREGDLVARGAPIGTVGQTGLATGPHLHWELRVSGSAVDPEAFLTRPLIDTDERIRIH